MNSIYYNRCGELVRRAGAMFETLIKGRPRVAYIFDCAIRYSHGVAAHELGDWEKALRVFQGLLSEGHGPSAFMLGTMYHCGEGVERDPAAAVGFYVYAFGQGDVRAAHRLGGMYTTGEGVEEDLQVAAAWYLQAAEQDHAPAQFTLGTMYANGTGVKENPLESIRWLRKAADGGHVHAQHDLEVAQTLVANRIAENSSLSDLPEDSRVENT